MTQTIQTTTINQSNDWYSQLTDRQREYLEKFRTFFFHPENNPEECEKLLERLQTGMKSPAPITETSEEDDEEPLREYTARGSNLVENALDDIPHLWYPYFPASALVGISGASEAV